MAAHFRDARLKVKRAEKHIDDLRIALLALKESCTATIERNPDTGFQELTHDLPHLEETLLDVSLIAGDALHNLRTAFDFAWSSLADKCRFLGDRDSRNFPFRPTMQGVKAALHGIEVDTRFPRIFDYIVNDVCPYSGERGDGLIYALNNLDVIDKHLLLLELVPTTAIKQITIKDANGQILRGGGMPMRGLSKLVIPFEGDVEIQNKGELILKVAINEAGMFKNMEVLRFIELFPEVVLGIVETLESFCP